MQKRVSSHKLWNLFHLPDDDIKVSKPNGSGGLTITAHYSVWIEAGLTKEELANNKPSSRVTVYANKEQVFELGLLLMNRTSHYLAV